MTDNPQCQDCLYYEYNEYSAAYECTVSLDEDEYERYCSRKYSSCPYYHSGDEYKTVRKQN
ncbi:MAG: hypothetical protein IJN12_02290 [Clostridia bacterium]|nr:hypothetical protein [Clostridia bacterium]